MLSAIALHTVKPVFCGRKNHFATVCKIKINSVRIWKLKITIVTITYSITHEIGPFKSKGKRWFINLEMQLPKCESQYIKCQLDTGSTCNTISFLNGYEMKNTNVKLKLYDGTILSLKGQYEINCRYNDKSLDLLFQIVEDSLTPLLSAEACEQLDLLQLIV